MVVLLLELPDLLLEAVFKKMIRRDLCYLRRTSKRVNELVESMRHQIASRADNKLRLLTFSYTAEHERPEKVIHIGGPDTLITRDLSCAIFNYTFPEEFDVYSQMVKFERGAILLKDPNRQLSAFSFDAVALNMGHINHMNSPEHCNKHMRMIFLCLTAMRLKCDRFYIGRIPLFFIKRILTLVQFNSLYINVDEQPGVEEFSSWPVFSCKERHLGMFSTLPESITPYLRNMTTGSLLFRVQEDPLHLISNYLMEVHKNRKIRDNVQSFTIAVKMYNFGKKVKELKLPGLVMIRQGRQHKRAFPEFPPVRSTLYKYPVDGGVAVILRDNEGIIDHDITVYFVDNDSNEDVYNRIAEKMFSTIPFDFSNFFGRFLSAKHGQKAFNDLYTGYGEKTTDWKHT